jgi:hypothetical protein
MAVAATTGCRHFSAKPIFHLNIKTFIFVVVVYTQAAVFRSAY